MMFCYGMFKYKRKFYQVIKSNVMVDNETQRGGRKRAEILTSRKVSECKMCHQCLYSLLCFVYLKFKGKNHHCDIIEEFCARGVL